MRPPRPVIQSDGSWPIAENNAAPVSADVNAAKDTRVTGTFRNTKHLLKIFAALLNVVFIQLRFEPRRNGMPTGCAQFFRTRD